MTEFEFIYGVWGPLMFLAYGAGIYGIHHICEWLESKKSSLK